MQFNPAIQPIGPSDAEHRPSLRSAKLSTAPGVDTQTSISFSLGKDRSNIGSTMEPPAVARFLPPTTQAETAPIQVDPQTNLNSQNAEMTKPRDTNDRMMAGPKMPDAPRAAPTNVTAKPNLERDPDLPETPAQNEDEQSEAVTVPVFAPETAPAFVGLVGWNAGGPPGHSPASAIGSSPTNAYPSENPKPGTAAQVTHSPLASQDASTLSVTIPSDPIVTIVAAADTAVQTPPLVPDAKSAGPALASPIHQPIAGSPESNPVAATPAAAPHDSVKEGSRSRIANDPVQPIQQQSPLLDGSMRSETKAVTPQLPPSLSPLAASTSIGVSTPTKWSLDDPITAAEVFVASDDPLPDLTAPHLREAGQPAQLPRLASELPRLIATQLADAVRSNPDKPIELTLNPEELGRVRMSFQTEAASLNVILQVERPETLDLMRRHIEQLAQEMHELGYDKVSFSFQQQRQDTASNGQSLPTAQQLSTTRTDPVDPLETQDVVQVHVGGATGMDIRI